MLRWLIDKATEWWQKKSKASSVDTENHPLSKNVRERPVANDVHPPSRRVKTFRYFNVSSLIADLVSLYFIYVAAAVTVDCCFEEFGLESEISKMVLKTFAMLGSVANVMTNFCTINPVEDADIFARTPQRAIKDSHPGCEVRLSKTLCLSNQILANLSYVIGSAGQMLSLTYFIPNQWVNIGVGVPLTTLGALYYHLLTHAKITDHANVFIHRLLQKELMLLKTLCSPLMSFEVILQSFSNAAYRGISFGFIMDQLLLRVFQTADDDSIGINLIAASTLLTFYVTIFSRTLNVHRQYFDPAFEKIPQQTLAETKISKTGFATDILVTGLRSGAMGMLLYRYVPLGDSHRIVIGVASAGLLAMHGGYVRYRSRLQQTALDGINKKPMLDTGLNADTDMDLSQLSKQKIFDMLRDSNEMPFAKIFVTTLNTSARTGRFLSFIGFLIGLNEALKKNHVLDLDFNSLLYLSGIWGITTLQNEWSFFESGMLRTVKYHATKWEIEGNNPYYGKWCSFFHSLEEYPKQYLQRCLQEQKPLLSRSTAVSMV